VLATRSMRLGWRTCNADPRCNARDAAKPAYQHGPYSRSRAEGQRRVMQKGAKTSGPERGCRLKADEALVGA